MTALAPELSVTDWQRSVAFYVDLLGFTLDYGRAEEGFAFLRLGEVALMLDQIGVGRDFQDGLAQGPLGRGVNLQIEVPSVAPLLRRLSAAGIALYLPLEETWYRRRDHEVGNRQFIVADPDGYLLRFAEDLGTRPLA